MEGDIRGCFDNIDHHILINIMRKRIKDESFIELLWKFLRAGYLEKWEYKTTYSGAPQGSGVCPILANIYLNELDIFMESLKKDFDRQNSYRKPQKAYSQTLGLTAYWKKKLKSAKAENNEQLLNAKTSPFKCAMTIPQCIQYALDRPAGIDIGTVSAAVIVNAVVRLALMSVNEWRKPKA